VIDRLHISFIIHFCILFLLILSFFFFNPLTIKNHIFTIKAVPYFALVHSSLSTLHLGSIL
jgi:hypothetical protein